MNRPSLYWEADDDVEDIGRYVPGGYHPVKLGDLLAPPPGSSDGGVRRYRVLHKLGRGAFGTVWFAESLHESSQRYVALKICVADANPQQELGIHSRLPHEEARHIMELLDSFTLQGPNGVHSVFVYNVLGSLNEAIRSSPGTMQVKLVCQQLVKGVAFLHRYGVVHGDIHLGNVGIALPTLNDHSSRDIMEYFGNPECTVVLPTTVSQHPDGLPPYLVPPVSFNSFLSRNDLSFREGLLKVEIMDLGNATTVDCAPRPSCTPAAVCAPEIMFERVVRSVDAPATKASDIWSLACTMYELVFGSRLFHFAAQNDALLGKMSKLCGEISPSWQTYWISKERLRDLDTSPETASAEWAYLLDHHSRTNSVLPSTDMAELISLLRLMLKMDPAARLSAEDVLEHPWLNSVGS
ncbi:uncharacterized protein PHACADRAFT_205571 [Phanerochaete carnosa HHB-10118-sp]|uniref:non-specific serine/threonine protein kinase n=1 Tax=Phanerochaete carnosa (strain HHB-10118-sp) TaxID=650164 RepID=K5WJT0_PHACS|nr:uncharacterized protein PHACADRAFT_205571 [Phanerochaete carnosa HHB-10118-sp]EKM59369.1 hypothetical protein PHACADRAFT_205571 [Phanerochaete carnosa HHB-10118-sp]